MNIYGLSDSGMCRAENQDCYAFVVLPEMKGKAAAHLAVVCDGMGGAHSGETASCLATAVFVEQMVQEPTRDERALKNAVIAANKAVYRKSQEEERFSGMGTTLVSVLVRENEVEAAYVGDSRAYLFRGGELSQLTHDHSYVQSLVDKGEITQEEAAIHPMKNLIMRAVGVKKAVAPDVFSFEWQEGDKILLCSDGFSNEVSTEQTVSILSSGVPLEQMARELIGAANCAGGDDNITVLLLENTKENEWNVECQ